MWAQSDYRTDITQIRLHLNVAKKYGREIDQFMELLSDTEIGCVIAYDIAIEMRRNRIESLPQAMFWLSKLINVHQTQQTEPINDLTLNKILRDSTQIPTFTRGRPAKQALDAVKIMPLETAWRVCTHGTGYGLRVVDFKEFRNKLEQETSKRGAMRAFLYPGSSGKRLFVTRHSSIKRVKRQLPLEERNSQTWPSRLRDLLGLWGIELYDFSYLVQLQFHQRELKKATLRTPTIFDAKGRREFVPCCSSDGWGLTVDGQAGGKGVCEAMLDDPIGGVCFLSSIGSTDRSGAAVKVSYLLERARQAYYDCRSEEEECR